MDDSQILKDLLYSEFAQGKRPTGRFQLRYKDVCKGHPKASGIDINELETSASELGGRQSSKPFLSLKRHFQNRLRQSKRDKREMP